MDTYEIIEEIISGTDHEEKSERILFGVGERQLSLVKPSSVSIYKIVSDIRVEIVQTNSSINVLSFFFFREVHHGRIIFALIICEIKLFELILYHFTELQV